MAKQYGLEIYPYEAGGDISTKQFYIFKSTTTDRRIAICSDEGDLIVGVLQNTPSAAGQMAAVAVRGISKVVRGAGTITAGIWVCPDSSGRAIPLALANQDEICVLGQVYAINGAANAGEIIEVNVNPFFFHANV